MTTTDTYALGNERAGTATMLDCLSDVLDDDSRDLLLPLLHRGTTALELGAGNGSMAGWLAEALGPDGRVIATDLRPAHIRAAVREHPRIQVIEHDIRLAQPPAGPFTLIHARLLFAHLAGREDVLARYARLLSPGGWMAIEDWGMANAAEVLYSPFPDTTHLYQRYQRALITHFAANGNEPRWSTRTNAAMRAAGLVDVHTTLTSRSWFGGEAGALLPVAVSAILRGSLVERGIDAESLDTLREHLADPRVVILGNTTWQTVGRRPEAA